MQVYKKNRFYLSCKRSRTSATELLTYLSDTLIYLRPLKNICLLTKHCSRYLYMLRMCSNRVYCTKQQGTVLRTIVNIYMYIKIVKIQMYLRKAVQESPKRTTALTQCASENMRTVRAHKRRISLSAEFASSSNLHFRALLKPFSSFQQVISKMVPLIQLNLNSSPLRSERNSVIWQLPLISCNS